MPVGRGVPGVVPAGYYREGTIPGTEPRPRLRLIYGILRYNGSYGRLTDILTNILRSEILGSRAQVQGQIQGQIQGPISGPGMALDWSRDRPLRILYLR